VIFYLRAFIESARIDVILSAAKDLIARGLRVHS